MKLKRILFMALMALVVQAASASVIIGGIAYSFNTYNTTATVVSGGEYTGDVVIPSSVTRGSKTYSVTTIDWSAFYNCTGLTSITIPNSVTEIGVGAFEGCSGLTSVTIGNSVTSIGSAAFSGTAWYNNQPDGLVYAGRVAYEYKGTMPSGTSIVLKDGTKGIAQNAFNGFTGLTSITIPNSVTSIGETAFQRCI